MARTRAGRRKPPSRKPSRSDPDPDPAGSGSGGIRKWVKDHIVVTLVVAIVTSLSGGFLLRSGKILGDDVDAVIGLGPTFQPLWPARAGCSDVMVAMPQGGPAIDEVDLPNNAEARNVLAQAGAAAWGSGTLDILIATPNQPLILDMRFDIDEPEPSQEYAWVMRTDSGCGGPADGEHLKLDLDEEDLVKVGSGGKEEKVDEKKDDESDESGDPHLRGIYVSQDKPYHLVMDVVACKALYQWTLVIDYMTGNEKRTYRAPVMRTGGGIAGVQQYLVKDGEGGRRAVVADGKSTATCPPGTK